MCNFNQQSDEAKAFLHLFMKKAAQNIGGENFLLALIEAMRSKKPYPLMFKATQIASNNSLIKWNKAVFKDKAELIQNILIEHKSLENPSLNILDTANVKKRKNIINMFRAIAPIEFVVTPQNPNDGEGFNFKPFDTMEDDFISFNPIFVAMFFCSVEFTKKALKYKV